MVVNTIMSTVYGRQHRAVKLDASAQWCSQKKLMDLDIATLIATKLNLKQMT